MTDKTKGLIDWCFGVFFSILTIVSVLSWSLVVSIIFALLSFVALAFQEHYSPMSDY